jgi:hypothetical protein
MKAANRNVTFQAYMTDDEIFDALCECGETGSYRVGGAGDLLIKREENSDELRYGRSL